MALLRTKVVISRHYHKPEITVQVHRMAAGPGPLDAIDVSMPLEDFLKAMTSEMQIKRWSTWWATSIYQNCLNNAADAVVERAKESGVYGLIP